MAFALPCRIALSLFILGVLTNQTALAQDPSRLQTAVVSFGNYLLKHWKADKNLRKYNPPQIITNISSTTQILGGCVSASKGTVSRDVGGTSYCPSSNTIYIVQDQLMPLYKYFGPASTAYVLAHEYGHYVQNVFDLPYKKVVSELQADCLSGSILGQGYKQLGITPDDVVNMAMTAYSIGDPSHGTGAQRAYAVYTGFGYSNEIKCSTKDMTKLSANQIADPTFRKLLNQRSTGRSVEYGKQENLTSISGSLGL